MRRCRRCCGRMWLAGWGEAGVRGQGSGVRGNRLRGCVLGDTASRNPNAAAGMMADALLRTVAGATATFRVAGSNANTDQSQVGLVATTFAEAGGFAGGDAQAAAGDGGGSGSRSGSCW